MALKKKLTVQGLGCSVGLSLAVSSAGSSLVVVHRFLTMGGLLLLQSMSSRGVGFNSCGLWAQ